MECAWDFALLQHSDKLPSELLEVIRHGGNEQYLETLTKTSLDPRYTCLIFAHCENLFAHISASFRAYGSVSSSVAALARVLPQAPHLHIYAEQLLSPKIDVSTFGDENDGITFLLGLLRLLSYDRRTFIKYTHLSDIEALLRHSSRPIVYLAIRIMQIHISGADDWFEKMVAHYLGPDSPDNAIDGVWDDRVIDYRFLTLWEHQRAEKLSTMLNDARQQRDSQRPETVRTLPQGLFDSSTALIGATLLPSAFVPTSTSQRSHDPVVITTTSLRNMTAAGHSLRQRRPLLFTGLAGSGKTLLVRHIAQRLGKLENMITLHLNEQSDAKLLIGVYTTGETPGSFVWRPGVLTTAVQEGRWVLIEDLDRAPNEIIGTLLPLIEKGELRIPNRKQTVYAASGFKLLATMRSTLNHRNEEIAPWTNMLGARHWLHVAVSSPPPSEIVEIAGQLYPVLQALLPQLVAVYERLQSLHRVAVATGQSKTGTLRPVSLRDMLKWCSRISGIITGKSGLTSQNFDDMFLEAVDCFVGSLPEGTGRSSLAAVVAEELRIDPQRRDYLLSEREPRYVVEKSITTIGRVDLPRRVQSRKLASTQPSFSIDPHTTRMLECVAATVVNREPLLLVGETGVGKTTTVQHLAGHLGKKLVPFNLSQQSESGDLLGGFKPVSIRSLIVPMKDEFDELFTDGFSATKNQAFIELLGKQMAKSNWKAVCKLWREALKMVEQRRGAKPSASAEAPAKKRKIETQRTIDFARWDAFAEKLAEVEKRTATGAEAFAFKYVEGNLVQAVRNGDWVLLDEINLAATDTLESIVDLLYPRDASILLTEAGNVERIVAHPEFRIFAAMNPATDVGKRDLPQGIRSRFTELFVESPDRDIKSLQSIVRSYLHHEVSTDKAIPLEVSTLYQKIQELSRQNKLVDGAGQRPHFSLRTLTRTLSYAKYIAPLCNLRRALYEGFQMSFLTFLDGESSDLVQPLLQQHLLGKLSNVRAELQKTLRKPADSHQYVQGFPGSRHWVRQGNSPLEDQPHYILTPFIRRNMENLVRAASTRRFPVLIQGPTSSGKTSMIEYLAKRTGHRFVRINNHEHTDLQEYLGTYASGADGRLQFQEGVLVKALREGHWLVLDELNLAPSEVLEALNRLLDDNRELLIPETQQIVRPHENFMLFATQNPAGLYGGRKTLSRAFRNRFLELHFDDIPIDELQEILHRRTHLPESRCKRIVSVYRELSVLRNESRLFEQKSFATLRDLFRWALRPNDTIEDLAANGFMLLAERVRKPEERTLLKDIIEKVMSAKGPKVRINEDMYGDEADELAQYKQSEAEQGVVWTKAMRRLYCLVSRAIQNNEPVLLVGETGCGKTTVCQILAAAMAKQLHTVNAHLNTETGDLIGSQRPLRNRSLIEAELRRKLRDSPVLHDLLASDQDTSAHSTDALFEMYDRSLAGLEAGAKQQNASSTHHQEIQTLRSRFKALFEWADGNLVEAMKAGAFFLLDEISLADDSVLERINSVLEPERSILLAEKGSLDSFVTALPGFQFFATMNPGGDYGKRELSPALRNRFTEIWVPSLSDDEDILQIVTAKIAASAKQFAATIVSFATWFKARFNTSSSSSTSIRDALAWVDFVNAFSNGDVIAAVVHGASMVYIDTLGANPAGLMSLTSASLADDRRECLQRLQKLLATDVQAIYAANIDVGLDDLKFSVGPFTLLRRHSRAVKSAGFSFEAPTTRINAMRTVRALQLPKPVMLEGSPGVGKTALVLAIASAAGVPLTRINMSEQTDLIDLFGSDAPVEGSDAGTFAWRDAPFLAAMKRGDWVLLDEMNLASQSVLEGLNACLDHRGEVFIPELGQTFSRHPDFKLFAAQNPHHQGGGRKGLPASFVNRFTVVYADAFRSEDLSLLCRSSFPDLDPKTIDQAVRLVDGLEREVTQNGRFGTNGRPWEFNLRDISRWLSLCSSNHGLLKSAAPWDLVDFLFSQRFRSSVDKSFVRSLFDSVFDDTPLASDLFSCISSTTLQLGLGYLPRDPIAGVAPSLSDSWTPGSTEQLHVLQSVIIGIQQRWPIILIGSAGSGKTQLIQRLAHGVGASLETVTMNADTDVMDLIGGYEQADPHREMFETVYQLRALLCRHVPTAMLQGRGSLLPIALSALDANHLDSSVLDKAVQALSPEVVSAAQSLLQSLRQQTNVIDKARFEWIDGVLVEALQQGKWLVLDHANLASPSVLDRLNSLLEPSGTLIINEHSAEDGSPRVITPHPNFRIFLTLNPRHGELSRAMRNRGVEIYISAEQSIEKPLIVGDPLFTESGVARFLQTRALCESGRGPSHQAAKVLRDHLSACDLPLLSRFQRQLSQGLYLNGSELVSSDSAPLLPEDWLQHLQKFCDDAASRKQLPADFAGVQTIHPLNNQALVQYPPETLPEASFLAFIYDSGEALASLKQTLQAVESDPNLLSRLRRLERSLKTVSQDSGSVVVKTLTKLLDSMALALQQSMKLADLNLAASKAIMNKLCAFWAILAELARTASFDAATLHAIVAIGKRFASKTTKGVDLYGTDLLPSISQTLSALDTSSSRGRGLACTKLWRLLKPDVPATTEDIEGLLKLESSADSFDDVCQCFDLSLQTMIEVRRGFAQSLSVASLGRDTLELSATLSQYLSPSLRAQPPPRQPHFRTAFKFLQEHFAWLGQKSQGLSQNEAMSLEILAGLKTSEASIIKSGVPQTIQGHSHLLSAGTWALRNLSLEDRNEADLAATIVRQLQSTESVSLSDLDLLQTETKSLGLLVASNANAISDEEALASLQSGLRKMLIAVLTCLSSSGHQRLGLAAQKLLMSLDESAAASPDSLVAREAHESQAVPRAVSCLSTVATYLRRGNSNGSDAAQAWASFAVACLELYVPDIPLDPTLEPQIEHDIHSCQAAHLAARLEALRLFKSRWSGNSHNVRTAALESDIASLGTAPSVDRIYRPKQSRLALLQQELDGLMRTTGSLKPQDLPFSATHLENLVRIRQRLGSTYRDYADFTGPVITFIDCLLVGHRLASRVGPATRPNSSSPSLGDLIPFAGGSINTWMSDNFFVDVTEDLRSLPERICWLQALRNRSADHELKDCSSSLRRATDEQFSWLFEQWRAKLTEDQRKDAAKSNLYKFRGDDGLDEPTEEELEELFPTVDAPSGSEGKPTSRQHVHDLAPAIATSHHAIFRPANAQIGLLSQLTSDWSSLQHNNVGHGDFYTALPAILASLHGLHLKFSVAPKSTSSNIYTDTNTHEVTNLLHLITKVEGRFSELQTIWPEHATPVEVLRLCEQIKAISHAAPLTQFLPLLEQLHATANEWQKVASREYSVREILDNIINLIVSWRQLELASWSGLFDREWKQRENDAASWWFVAYESIIAASQDIDNTQDLRAHTEGLLKTLHEFILSSGLGEYGPRIKMLRGFESHLNTVKADNNQLSIVRSGLSNFIVFFESFEPTVTAAISRGRTELEKKINELIQLASWKDRNIDVLRQSAQSSHKKLLRLVRQYRALLAQPVAPILAAGIPDRDHPSRLNGVQEFGSSHLVVKSDEPTNPFETWNGRPDRFRNIRRTVDMIISKTGHVDGVLNGSEQLDYFIADLAKSVAELQKATPAILTEENKKQVNHLKTRKRRVLADTLRDLRQMGFQYTVSQPVLDQQSTLEAVLASVQPLNHDEISFNAVPAEYHFNRFIDIMPFVRESARKHSEDLTPAEITRCISLQENLLHFARQQRNSLDHQIHGYLSLTAVVHQLKNFGSCLGPTSAWKPPQDLQVLHRWLTTLDSVIRHTKHLLGTQSGLAEKDFSDIAADLERHDHRLHELRNTVDKLPQLPPGLSSAQAVEFYGDCKAFGESLRLSVDSAIFQHPETMPVLSNIYRWLLDFSITENSFERNGYASQDPEVWTQTAFAVLDAILGSVQDLTNAHHSTESADNELEKNWLFEQQRLTDKSIKALHVDVITELLKQLSSMLHNVESESTLAKIASICQMLFPVVQAYLETVRKLIASSCDLHTSTSRTAYKLATIFVQIAKQGFCTPSEKSQDESQKGNIESGTGLGEGEGAEDISKDIQDDEDLSELAQEAKAQKNEGDEMEDVENAVDMDNEELEGEVSDAAAGSDEDQDGDDADDEAQQDLDEEQGQVDNNAPSAVDEKMWNGDEDKKQDDMEGDAKEGDSKREDVPAGGEGTEEQADAPVEEEMTGVDEPEDKTEEIGQDPKDQVDTTAQEQDNLELPEDIDMGGRDVDDDQDSDLGDISDNQVDEKDEVDTDEPPKDEDVNPTSIAGEDEEPPDTEANKEAGEDADEDDEADAQSDILMQEDDKPFNDPINDDPSADVGQGPDRADNGGKNHDAAENELEDAKEEQRDNDQEDSGAAGGQQKNSGQDENTEQSTQTSDQRELPYKQLGDVLNEWYNQHRKIEDVSEPQTSEQERDVDMADARFEHVPEGDTSADTQALGVASAEQSTALNEEQALPVNEDDETDLPFQDQPRDDNATEDPMEQEQSQLDPSTGLPPEPQSNALTGQDAADEMDIDIDESSGIEKDDFEDVDEQLTKTHISHEDEMEVMSMEEARQQWAHHEDNTRNLSLMLTERLRLILQPTLATKMRGDYRTGKRLNIKRIIPYIASSFKRDKIWMRRSVPSKRAYQVMLAIDDSKSMSESGSRELAFETLALVARSLSMLEVGELSIVGFGEDVNVAHDFSTSFSPETGAEVLQKFTFTQRKTNVRKLLAESIELLREARLKATGATSDLWQLQLIISDGVCEDHPSIRQLVRQAQEEQIMIVFIVVDAAAQQTAAVGGASSQSIFDLQTAEFVKDAAGEMQLKMVKYLDTFPFNYYLIVRDVTELPEVLAGALRQWFSEVVGSGAS